MQAQTVATPRINSIGKKAIMAVTGVVWIGFVAAHMWGNLHLFQGQAAFNHYAEWLREVGEPVFSYAQILWILRIVIVTSIVLHIWAALTLWRQADRARSTKYAVKRVVKANYATRFMRIGGVLIFLFILFHLAQFTWGWQPGFQREDPYSNVYAGFSNPIVVIFYLLALVALGLHLYHGVWSMFQTLGLNTRRLDRLFYILAIFTAIVIPLGFALVPVAVLTGFVPAPATQASVQWLVPAL